VIEQVEVWDGQAAVRHDLYRPPVPGPHPGVVVCLGVVPNGYDHPQVARLGSALARSGFVALIYRSPKMGEHLLDRSDIDGLARSFAHLRSMAVVDSGRTGLYGTCVGGSFALMAAAHPEVRGNTAFVGAFAPFASLRTLTMSVTSSSRQSGGGRIPWAVDPLTRKVFVTVLTSRLAPHERDLLRRESGDGPLTGETRLSPEAQAVRRVLLGVPFADAATAVDALPRPIIEEMARLSPVSYIADYARLW
jgi:hypothetical protein